MMVKEHLYPAASSWCNSEGRVVQALHMFQLFPLPGKEGLRTFWVLASVWGGRRQSNLRFPQQKPQEGRQGSRKVHGYVGEGRAKWYLLLGTEGRCSTDVSARGNSLAAIYCHFWLKNQDLGKFSTWINGTEKFPTPYLPFLLQMRQLRPASALQSSCISCTYASYASYRNSKPRFVSREDQGKVGQGAR